MSLVEQARARLEEVRAKLEELRGEKGVLKGKVLGSSGPLLGSSNTILANLREKGALVALEERFPRVKELRERRILGAPPKGGGPKGGGIPSPATKEPPVVDRQEPSVRARARARVLL